MLRLSHALATDRLGPGLAVAVAVGLAIGLTVLCACRTGSDTASASEIQARESGRRVAAIRRAAGSGDRSMVPLLIDRLEDEDAAVRFAAIMGLEQLTGTRMGYRIGLPAAERRRSVARWRWKYCSGGSSIGQTGSTHPTADGVGDGSL